MRRATPGRLAAGISDSDDDVGGFLVDGLAGCKSRGCWVTGFDVGLPDPS